MATVDNERYLRHILLFGEGGTLVFQEILKRETRSAGKTLAVLLEENKDQLKLKLRDKKRLEKVFPLAGHVDTQTWDISLLATVILQLFETKLSDKDCNEIRKLKEMRNDLAHLTSVSKTDREYTNHRNTLTTALNRLSQGLDRKTHNKCQKIIKDIHIGPIEIQAVTERVKELSINDEVISKEYENLTGAVENLAGNIEKTNRLSEDIKEILQTMMQKDEKYSFKEIGTTITLRGHNHQVTNNGEDTFVKAFNSETLYTRTNEKKKLSIAAKNLLGEIEKCDGVKVNRVYKKKCVRMAIKCSTCRVFLELINFFEGIEVQKIIRALELSLNGMLKTCFRITVEMPYDSLMDMINSSIKRGATKQTSTILVAAIDFGTSFSGYAFSFKDDPSRIQMNQQWAAGSERLISLKTPTSILLDPDEKFHSFGFEAENKYARLAEDEENENWLFFKQFKMLLHNNKRLSRKSTITDINGKRKLAIEIFALSIQYLKAHLLTELTKQRTGIDESDIQYVITVPAIWDDSGKQFMREAAMQADIDTMRLKLALEPEAASIWCQTIRTESERLQTNSNYGFIVVDLGGGTADICVYKKKKDGTLKELCKASGGPWGGKCVDNCCLKMIENLFGHSAIKALKTEAMSDYFDLLRNFETKKMCILSTTRDTVTIRVPAILLEGTNTCQNFEERKSKLNIGQQIVMKKDRLHIDPAVVRSWFDIPVDKVIQHVQSIFSNPKIQKIDRILLVGGFGESEYVQEKFRKAFKDIDLIIPPEPSLAVLKGAVRFGHIPTIVSARVMRFSYGVSTTRDFDETTDPETSMIMINGRKKIGNIFDKYITVGDALAVGHKVKKTYTPNDTLASSLVIYKSENSNPEFVTDSGCSPLGELTIDHPEGDSIEDKITDVMLILGDTELIVKAKIRKTGRVFNTTINCLH